MARDPFYEKILERLGGKLDPDIFELSVCDLVRDAGYPVVPVPGGKDAGVDGAVFDGKSEPYPLIATTAKDYRRNLRRSLKSYKESGQKRREAIFVTSQQITPSERRRLESSARELGFTLVQTVERVALANMLYRNSRWCAELLGITGNPPALSRIPLGRPLSGNLLVGRGPELEWLAGTQGDRLLVGQPGSGKTFLAHHYARSSNGLFVVSTDVRRVFNAIRDQRPDVLVVDDTHDRMDFLESLLHARADAHAHFDILAICWPSEADVIQNRLSLPSASVRHLKPLSRDEIVEIVTASGVEGSVRLIKEIVDQAEGRPGLAVTLSLLCLNGDVEGVVLGTALAGAVREWFDQRLGKSIITMLGCLAVGGTCGMPLLRVADFLNKPLDQMHDDATKLAAGGILRDVGNGHIAVTPRQLQHSLIRDVFFGERAKLPYDELLSLAPDFSEAVRAFVGARRLDAKIDFFDLVSLVEKANTDSVWEAFASLDEDSSRYVVAQFPEVACRIPHPLLHHVPESVLPLLLKKSIGNERPLNSTMDHPLRIIQDWVRGQSPWTRDPVAIRRTLLTSVRRWLVGGGDVRTGYRALAMALFPAFDLHETDAGEGRTVTVTWGMLSLEQIEQIAGFWTTVVELLREHPVSDWSALFEMIHGWVFPSSHSPRSPDDETYKRMRIIAGEMAKDVASLAPTHIGVAYWLRGVAEDLGVDLPSKLPGDLEIVFPPDDREDREATAKRQIEDVRALARKYANDNPSDVLSRLARASDDLASLAHVWPNYLHFLCCEIADKCTNPEVWARAALDARCIPDVVLAFLSKVSAFKTPEVEALLSEAIESDEYQIGACNITLQMENAPTELLDTALERISGEPKTVQNICMFDRIPTPNLTRLLQHPDVQIAGAAAVGISERHDDKGIPESLSNDWKRAIANYPMAGYHVAKILAKHPCVAEEWLGQRLREQSPPCYITAKEWHEVIQTIDKPARRRLLRELPATYQAGEVVAILVGDDVDLYRELLDNPALSTLHLRPLEGIGGDPWLEKAKLALQKRHTHHEIAMASFPWREPWCGKDSDRHAGRIEQFERLSASNDSDMKRIAESGIARARADYEDAIDRERDEAVHGLD